MESPPPLPAPAENPDRDTEQLRMLALLHWVWAALALLGGLGFGAMMIVASRLFGRFMESAGARSPNPPPEEFSELFTTIYGGMGVVYMVAGSVLSIFAVAVALQLREERRRTFCLVGAAVQCIAMPFGTALGVFTILVLMRPSVIRRFEHGARTGVPHRFR